MSLCPYAYLRVSLSGLLTAPDQGSLPTSGELFNISALDPLLPTLLIATLCLCVLLTILYYSLAVAWEVFWASRRSPSPLDPSAEVVLTPLPTGHIVGKMHMSSKCTQHVITGFQAPSPPVIGGHLSVNSLQLGYRIGIE